MKWKRLHRASIVVFRAWIVNLPPGRRLLVIDLVHNDALCGRQSLRADVLEDSPEVSRILRSNAGDAGDPAQDNLWGLIDEVGCND